MKSKSSQAETASISLQNHSSEVAAAHTYFKSGETTIGNDSSVLILLQTHPSLLRPSWVQTDNKNMLASSFSINSAGLTYIILKSWKPVKNNIFCLH